MKIKSHILLIPILSLLFLLPGCKREDSLSRSAESDTKATVTMSLRAGSAVGESDPNAKDGDNLFTKVYVAAVSATGKIEAYRLINVTTASSGWDVELSVPAGSSKTFYAIAYGATTKLSATDDAIKAFTTVSQLLALMVSEGRTATSQVFSGRTAPTAILASDRDRVIELPIRRAMARIDLYIHKNKEQLGDALMKIKEITIANLRDNSPVIFPFGGYNDPVDYNKIKNATPYAPIEESISTVSGSQLDVPEDKPTAPQYTIYTYPVFPATGAAPGTKPRIAIKTEMSDGNMFTYTANIEDDNQTEHKGDLLPNRIYKVDAELGDRTAEVKLEVVPWGTEPYRREVYLFREFEIEVLNQEYSTHLTDTRPDKDIPTVSLNYPKASVRIKRTIGGLSSGYTIKATPSSGQFIVVNPAPGSLPFAGLASEPVGKQYSFDLSYDISGVPTVGTPIATIEITVGTGPTAIKRILELKVLAPKS